MKKTASFFIAVLIILGLAYAFFTKKPTLHIFMWSGYIKPELISSFEKKFHCSISVDAFDSNEAMYTKLKFSGSGYDIIFPSHYYLDLLIKQNLIEPIQKEQVPNSTYVDNAFLKRLNVQESPYGIPFLLSFSGILCRSDRIHVPVDSWNIFSNTSYKGRMTLLNDIRETVGASLRELGFSANTLNIAELQQAKMLLFQWKKNIAKFESEQHKNGIAGAEFLIVHGFANDCYQIRSEHPEVQFVYPKEGSLVSIDYISLCPNSKQKKLAYHFINFLLEPENAAKNMLYTGGRAPHTDARNCLPKELQSSPLFYPEDSPSIQLECLKPLGENQKLYSNIWNQVRNQNQ
jgi:spermidine/putrescine transport system substrate-binding protein